MSKDISKNKSKHVNQLKKFFKDKRVLVTGHTGFKGSWLTQILLNFGVKVSGYSLKPNTNPNVFTLLGIKNKTNNHFEDIRDFEKLLSVFKKEKPEIVFHLAAQPIVRDSYDEPLHTYTTNVIGTANVLQAIKDTGDVKAAVMITTDKVYENKEWVWAYRESDELGGHDPYSTSKACAELVIRSYIRSFFNQSKKSSVFVASARAGNVIGGGDWANDRLIPDIIKSVFEKNEKIEIRSPEAIRPWQHVLEPLFGYLILAKGLAEGNSDLVGAWNFAPNEDNFITVEEVLKKGLGFLKKGEYFVKQDHSKHETKLLKLDATKAKENLGWKPLLDINETLQWTFEWYKAFHEKKNIVALTNNQIKKFCDMI